MTTIADGAWCFPGSLVTTCGISNCREAVVSTTTFGFWLLTGDVYTDAEGNIAQREWTRDIFLTFRCEVRGGGFDRYLGTETQWRPV